MKYSPLQTTPTSHPSFQPLPSTLVIPPPPPTTPPPPDRTPTPLTLTAERIIIIIPPPRTLIPMIRPLRPLIFAPALVSTARLGAEAVDNAPASSAEATGRRSVAAGAGAGAGA